jgi:hypothetical protein
MVTLNAWLLSLLVCFCFLKPYDPVSLDEMLIEMEPTEFIESMEGQMEYSWSEKEIEYAALLVQSEAGGLGEDAALSILSNIYARYTSPVWCQSYYCSTTLLEEMVRPNQYVGPEVALYQYGDNAYERIRPESYLYVYKFILGFTGSCSGDGGYEYFNSTRGGPVDCEIEVEDGRFLEFWSTENFNYHKDSGLYRNLEEGLSVSLENGGRLLPSIDAQFR